MFLTKEELIELTGKRVSASQIKQLRHMGIEHRIRADGSVVVLESHIDKEFDGAQVNVKTVKHTEPNWGAVR